MFHHSDWTAEKIDNVLPVTLSTVRSMRNRGEVIFEWRTATETGNAGFNLWVESADGLVKVNTQLIPSKVIDSVEPTDYSVTLATDASVSLFFIEEVGVDGVTERMGPYLVGAVYGNDGNRIPDEGSVKVFLPVILR